MRVIYSIGSRLAGGGIGNTAYHAARGIHRAGHLRRLYCLGREPTEIPDDAVRSLWFPSRRYLRLPVLHYYWFKDRSFDRRVARRLDAPLDLFHGWNSHCLASLQRARALGATTFVERASAHSAVQARLLEEEHERFGLRAPPRLRRLVERSVAEYEVADYIRIPSDFVRQSFLDEGVPEAKLVQGPFGVDASRFTPQPEPAVFTALSVGHVDLRKGALDLLEAWQRMGASSAAADAPRLVLRGWVDDAIAPLVDAYRSRCRFETPGFTQDVATAYADASVLVLPAIEDGYPLVVLEAMASGRPVIVSENTGSKDAVRDGVDGFVVPVRSPDALAEKLAWLLEHPAERAAMGRAAREQALKFPWQRYGDELVAAYERVLAD
ncbi:glycosyltransferase family 4 protein [bacterium]|nr:glycosyltransferase family 4 protein [bacterium]